MHETAACEQTFFRHKIMKRQNIAMTRIGSWVILLASVSSAFLLAACSGQKIGETGNTASDGGSVRLQGSGSTFVKPMMDKWMSEYGKANPSIRADYQSTGSGAGIKA